MSTDPRHVTWGELDPGRTWPDDPFLNPEGITPATVVTVGPDRHPLFRYDAGQTARAYERCREMGGAKFRVSPDLGYQLLGDLGPATDYGWDWLTDPTLPPNAIIAEAQDYISREIRKKRDQALTDAGL